MPAMQPNAQTDRYNTIGMGPIVIVLIIIPLFIAAWLISVSNNIVRLNRLCDNAWAGIDVALKRRYDLIPNLVETVKAFAKHEQETFEKVIQLRNQASGSRDVHARIESETMLAAAMSGLVARAEAYPDLRSSANFLELQKELAMTEDRIAAARRFYNANVRDFNIAIETFPGSMLKGDKSLRESWEIDDPTERQAVKVSL